MHWFPDWNILHHSRQFNQIGDLFRLCPSTIFQLSFSEIANQRLQHFSDFICFYLNLQAHLAPSGYLKMPNVSNSVYFLNLSHSWSLIFVSIGLSWKLLTLKYRNPFSVFQDMDGYLSKCRFLPRLNNELPGERNATYKERFTSLRNLVLIMVSYSSAIVYSCFSFLSSCMICKLRRYVSGIWSLSLSLSSTVWTWHCFNTEGNLLVWVLSRWGLHSSFATKAGIVLSW